MSERAVLLFGGCGGSSLGAERAGYRTTAYEYWQPAVECHNANGMEAILHDLSDPSLDHRRRYSLNEPAPALAFGNDVASWCWERPSSQVGNLEGPRARALSGSGQAPRHSRPR